MFAERRPPFRILSLGLAIAGLTAASVDLGFTTSGRESRLLVVSASDGTSTLNSFQLPGLVPIATKQIEGDKAADDRWAEDWNDEDQDDTFDKVAEKCNLAAQSGATVSTN